MRPLIPKDLDPHSHYARELVKDIVHLDIDLLYLRYIGEAVSRNVITTKHNQTSLPKEIWITILDLAQHQTNTNVTTGLIISKEKSDDGKPLLHCSFRDDTEELTTALNDITLCSHSASNSASTSTPLSTTQMDSNPSDKIFTTTIDDPPASQAERALFPPCLFVCTPTFDRDCRAREEKRRRQKGGKWAICPLWAKEDGLGDNPGAKVTRADGDDGGKELRTEPRTWVKDGGRKLLVMKNGPRFPGATWYI